MDDNTIVQFVKLTQKGNEEKLYNLRECYVNSIEAKLFEINKYNLEKIIIGEKQITSNYHQYVCQKLLVIY